MQLSRCLKLLGLVPASVVVWLFMCWGVTRSSLSTRYLRLRCALDDNCPAIRCQAGRTVYTLQVACSEGKGTPPQEMQDLVWKTRRILIELSGGAYPDYVHRLSLPYEGWIIRPSRQQQTGPRPDSAGQAFG